MSPSDFPKPPEIKLPPVLLNEQGTPRTVGVEMEFCGMDLDAITGAVTGAVGGRVVRESDYKARIEGTRIGDFRAEFDATVFRDMKLRKFLESLNLDSLIPDIGESIEEFMASEAGRFVPFELVFAPLPIERLPELEAVRLALIDTAEGTNASVFNAFGLHLNPELPRVDIDTVLAHLRAFLLLFERLRILHQVDYSRRLGPFIDPFPDEYAQLVLEPDYSPTLDRLIEDYTDHNPTRNRPLDLLPVLAWMDESHVTSLLPDEKISRRPTFHYRLPNCQIDERDWSIALEWNRWVKVEELAANAELLSRGMREGVVDGKSSWTRFWEGLWK